jgi:DNA-binding transcriptional regulator YiaG
MTTLELSSLSAVRLAARSGEARRIREKAMVSQAELARHLGVAVATLSRWENGERSPRSDLALRYSEALDTLRSKSSGRTRRSPQNGVAR